MLQRFLTVLGQAQVSSQPVMEQAESWAFEREAPVPVTHHVSLTLKSFRCEFSLISSKKGKKSASLYQTSHVLPQILSGDSVLPLESSVLFPHRPHSHDPLRRWV